MKKLNNNYSTKNGVKIDFIEYNIVLQRLVKDCGKALHKSSSYGRILVAVSMKLKVKVLVVELMHLKKLRKKNLVQN
jgi:hypothetical protein